MIKEVWHNEEVHDRRDNISNICLADNVWFSLKWLGVGDFAHSYSCFFMFYIVWIKTIFIVERDHTFIKQLKWINIFQ